MDIFLLCKLMIRIGIPKSLVSCIYRLTYFRRVTGYNGGHSLGTRVTCKGSPQDSVLSPILFNIYTSQIRQNITHKIKVVMYTDDIALYYANKNLAKIVRTLNTASSEMVRYLIQLNLKPFVNKTKVCYFSSRNKILVKMNDSALEVVNRYTYLGFHMSYNLNWKWHINIMKGRTVKALNIMKLIAGIGWGSHQNNMILAYKSLMRPYLDWGCVFFDSSSDSTKCILDRVQFAALRIALSMMGTTPINILLDLANETPLQERRQYLKQKFIARILASEKHPLKKIIEERLTVGNREFNDKKFNIIRVIDDLKPLVTENTNFSD